MQLDCCLERVVMTSLCETINTARSLSVYLLFKYENDFNIIKYLKQGLNPEEYDSSELFEKDYLIFKILSKWEGYEIDGVDIEAATVAQWLACEDQNGKTNARLTSATNELGAVAAVMFTAQRKISSILGPAPSLLEWSDHCSWSNGSTYDLRRGTTALQKLTSKLTVTPQALLCACHVVGMDLHWCQALGLNPEGPCCLLPNNFTIVGGERFSTVPKDATIRRTIGIQPTANIFLQKGLGAVIRSKLRRVGVLLNDQSRNQTLARNAIKCELATVDIENASNTLARALVLDLLPIDWVNKLYVLRCPSIEGPELGSRSLNMWSAMGNGYTFELESLVFYGLAFASCEVLGLDTTNVSVYGDDIIIPRAAFNLLSEVLTHCGFKVNQRKSFSSGVFFESCGHHYFNERLVSPIFQKKPISGKREELIRFHNRLYRWSKRTGVNLERQLKIIIKAYKALGDKDVPRIPDFGSDDSGFLCDPNTLGVRDDNRGYHCVVYRPTKAYIQGNPEIAFLALALRRSCYKNTRFWDEPEDEPSYTYYSKFDDSPKGLSADIKGYAMLSDRTASYAYTRCWINQ